MSSLTSSQNAVSETPDTSPGPTETPSVELSTDGTPTATTETRDKDHEDELMEEIDDTVMTLPLSKIKRIFKMDPDYFAASPSAVYATGVATELFIQYFVEHAAMLAKMDKRKKIQYKDFSNAVSTQDALHFLSDTVPKTQTVGQAIKERNINMNVEDQERYEGMGQEVVPVVPEVPVKAAPVLPKGQKTLSFQPVKNPVLKKAVIHDLMSNSDSMVIDG